MNQPPPSAQPAGPTDAGPRVTIGLPTYDRPTSLARALEAIIEQDYAALDILVSDNGSPGSATEDVVRSYMSRDPRIRYVRQARNRGPFFNFGFVLAERRSDFFMWAADDDQFGGPHLVRRLVETALGDDDVVLAFPNVSLVRERRAVEHGALTAKYGGCRTDVDYRRVFCRAGGGFPMYGLFHLARLRARGIRLSLDQGLRYVNDGVMMHTVFARGGARFVEDVHIRYARTEANLSTRAPSHLLLLDAIGSMRRLFKLYGRSRLPPAEKRDLLTHVFVSHARWSWHLLFTLLNDARRKYIGRSRKTRRRLAREAPS